MASLTGIGVTWQFSFLFLLQVMKVPCQEIFLCSICQGNGGYLAMPITSKFWNTILSDSLYWFNGISTLGDYLMPNPVYTYDFEVSIL